MRGYDWSGYSVLFGSPQPPPLLCSPAPHSTSVLQPPSLPWEGFRISFLDEDLCVWLEIWVVVVPDRRNICMMIMWWKSIQLSLLVLCVDDGILPRVIAACMSIQPQVRKDILGLAHIYFPVQYVPSWILYIIKVVMMKQCIMMLLSSTHYICKGIILRKTMHIIF